MNADDPRLDELVAGYDTQLHSHAFDRTPTQDTRLGLDGVENVRTITTTPYSATYRDEFLAVDSTAGVITVTLPAPRGGKRYTIVRVAGANNVVVQGATGLVNGAASVTISTSFSPLKLKHYLTGYISG